MKHRQTIPLLFLALAVAPMMVSPVAAQAPAAQRVVLPTDRSVLPIPEPVNPPITEVDARKATPPPRFEVKAPAGEPLEVDGRGVDEGTELGASYSPEGCCRK